MNTAQYMDKQIMDLSQGSSQSNSNFIDLMNNTPPQEEFDRNHNRSVNDNGNGIEKEEIVPSYDFQPIRPTSAGSTKFTSFDGGLGASARAWNSADSKTNNTPVRNYSSLASIEPAKVILEKDRNVFDDSIVSEIDLAMKKHADNLLHVLEGVSARLTQLETRTRQLENSVDDLKVSVGNNYGSTDGKMRQLENILREVQTGVQGIKDKQEIVEAQLQLAKLQLPKVDPPSETQTTMHVESLQHAASAPQASLQQLTPVSLPQSLPGFLHPNAPPPPPPQQNLTPPVQLPNQFHQNRIPSVPQQQNLTSPVQLPNQFPQNQIPSVTQQDSYFPPRSQTQEVLNQQYQLPPPATLQPRTTSAAPLHHQYQPALQPPQPPQQHPSLGPVNPPQLQPSLGHHPEEPPYNPSQNYPPNLRQPPSQPPTGPPPSQQFYGAPSHIYEPPSSRSGSGYSSGYGPPSGPSEPYPFSGHPSQYSSSSSMKPQKFSSTASGQSGVGSYPQLPTARILPHALPTASGTSGAPGSPRTGNRVPIDDVVDKVTSMGFPLDHVRATVRKLTENGQSVDLNVVLDKLMKDGEVPPPKTWFGR